MDWSQVGYAVLFPTGRAVFGWAENALEDQKITPFEWQELGVTILKIGVPATAAWLAINQLSPGDVGLVTTVAVMTFIHIFPSIWKWITKTNMPPAPQNPSQ